MRVLEPSTTRQQTSNGSGVLEFVINELAHDVGTVTLWGWIDGEAMWRNVFRSTGRAFTVKMRPCLSESDSLNVLEPIRNLAKASAGAYALCAAQEQSS